MSQLRLKTRWWSTTHPLVSFLEFISIFGRAACDSCFPLAYVYEIFILRHLLNIYPEKTLNSEFGFSRIYGHLMLNWYRLTLFSGIRPMILLLLNMPSHVANSTAYSWYALLDISLGSVRSARLPRVLHIVYIFRVAVSIPAPACAYAISAEGGWYPVDLWTLVFRAVRCAISNLSHGYNI